MNTFLVKDASIAGFDAYVVATGIHNPLEDRTELEAWLRDRSVHGHVFFDLLLTFGSKQRRFLSAKFDGSELSALDIVTDAPEQSLQFVTETLKSNFDSLDVTLLSKPLATAVKHGFVLR